MKLKIEVEDDMMTYTGNAVTPANLRRLWRQVFGEPHFVGSDGVCGGEMGIVLPCLLAKGGVT